jgi:hypothetical protein
MNNRLFTLCQLIGYQSQLEFHNWKIIPVKLVASNFTDWACIILIIHPHGGGGISSSNSSSSSSSSNNNRILIIPKPNVSRWPGPVVAKDGL